MQKNIPNKKKISYKKALSLGLKKKCKCCGEELTLDKFYKNPSGRYGVHAKCWRCMGIINKQSPKKSYEEAIKKGLKKVCNGCGDKLSVDNFHRNKLGKYGSKPKCKKCMQIKLRMIKCQIKIK